MKRQRNSLQRHSTEKSSSGRSNQSQAASLSSTNHLSSADRKFQTTSEACPQCPSVRTKNKEQKPARSNLTPANELLSSVQFRLAGQCGSNRHLSLLTPFCQVARGGHVPSVEEGGEEKRSKIVHDPSYSCLKDVLLSLRANWWKHMLPFLFRSGTVWILFNHV
ncbi:hypothetical protein NPIL_178951 [Nephila pilipes]|uniref:Uncharacterized protein n=1 Tax=Nephila pilipes TaxID=299642 RepID=A0A8X6ND28_NEPPI|nr:hypothetical protein NPIL_178951 [Nephila pilipes]